MKFLKNLVRDEPGATAIEYGLIAALIAVAAMGAMSTLGEELEGTFGDVESSLEAGRAAGAGGGGSSTSTGG